MTEQEIRSRIQKCVVNENTFIQLVGQRKSVQEYYKSLGYTIIKKDSKRGFIVNTEDLVKGSNKRIKIKCPQCGKIRTIQFIDCFHDMNFTGLCNKCHITNLGKSRAKDITAKKFGRLTALESTKRRKGSNIVWKCQCECGNITYVPTKDLQSGNTKSCGCLNKERLEDYNRSRGYRISSDYTDEENNEYLNDYNNFYHSSKWKKVRKEILKRDKECKICGSTKDLHIHHIYRRLDQPEYQYDQEKLITLCNSCHQKYHAQTDDITEITFLIWLNSLKKAA